MLYLKGLHWVLKSGSAMGRPPRTAKKIGTVNSTLGQKSMAGQARPATMASIWSESAPFVTQSSSFADKSTDINPL